MYLLYFHKQFILFFQYPLYGIPSFRTFHRSKSTFWCYEWIFNKSMLLFNFLFFAKKNIKKQHRPERNPDTSEANWQTLTFHVSPIHVALMHALFNALRRIL